MVLMLMLAFRSKAAGRGGTAPLCGRLGTAGPKWTVRKRRLLAHDTVLLLNTRSMHACALATTPTSVGMRYVTALQDAILTRMRLCAAVRSYLHLLLMLLMLLMLLLLLLVLLLLLMLLVMLLSEVLQCFCGGLAVFLRG